VFKLFEIKQTSDSFPIEYLKEIYPDKRFYYEELSITDKLRFELEQRKKNISLKIRIPQMKEIGSLHVLKINDQHYKVYNAYHFTNKDDIKQSDLTLEIYTNVKLEGDL
jgi:hypothetical protein